MQHRFIYITLLISLLWACEETNYDPIQAVESVPINTFSCELEEGSVVTKWLADTVYATNDNKEEFVVTAQGKGRTITVRFVSDKPFSSPLNAEATAASVAISYNTSQLPSSRIADAEDSTFSTLVSPSNGTLDITKAFKNEAEGQFSCTAYHILPTSSNKVAVKNAMFNAYQPLKND